MEQTDPRFTTPAVREWWAAMPAIHDSGTAFKGWLQRFPKHASRDDREAAHAAIMKIVVPHHAGAEDLSYICVKKEAPRR